MTMEGTVKAMEEDVILTWMKRAKRGLHLRVKVSADVEEFFKNYAKVAESSRDYGTSWLPPDEKGKAPQVWHFRAPIVGDGSYTLNNVGENLNLNNGNLKATASGRGGMMNISFLRLVGASEGEGVSFVIDTIISKPEMDDLAQQITKACAQFYNDYIKPVSHEIKISCIPVYGGR